MQATPSGRLRSSGKQVLLDGRHLCDARDEAAAEGIALALDFAGVAFSHLPPDVAKKILGVLS